MKEPKRAANVDISMDLKPPRRAGRRKWLATTVRRLLIRVDGPWLPQRIRDALDDVTVYEALERPSKPWLPAATVLHVLGIRLLSYGIPDVFPAIPHIDRFIISPANRQERCLIMKSLKSAL